MVEWDKITAAAVAVIEKSSTSPPATRRSKRIRNQKITALVTKTRNKEAKAKEDKVAAETFKREIVKQSNAWEI